MVYDAHSQGPPYMAVSYLGTRSKDVDFFTTIFESLRSLFITIPLDNATAILYVIGSAILQLFALFTFGGAGGSGGGGISR